MYNKTFLRETFYKIKYFIIRFLIALLNNLQELKRKLSEVGKSKNLSSWVSSQLLGWLIAQAARRLRVKYVKCINYINYINSRYFDKQLT